ncbi:ATP synthase F1 subunit epsilon [Candidatus Gottesmanbacteria bacterium]|nr:ATP synthase F1 subunit epsilon [Candidatus Gottesmanbacteria bacterium]
MTEFLLEIITPSQVAYSDQVSMVTAPSASGIIGILAHHMPLFSRLIEGELIIKKGKEETYFAIGGGFVQVTNQKVTILVTSAYNSDEMNEQEVLTAKKRAEEALKEKTEEKDYLEAQAAFRRSVIALKVLHRRRTQKHLPSVS